MAWRMVRLLFRRQALEAGVGGQLDIDAEAVGQAPGFFDQQRVGIGDGLEVDVAAEVHALRAAAGPRGSVAPWCSPPSG
jgi:hypothetical protein